jgi:hypothetical protein
VSTLELTNFDSWNSWHVESEGVTQRRYGRLINGTTRLLALIGHPVEHSLSPRMHNAAFAADGLDFVYVCLDVDPDDLPAAVKGAAALKLRGFNITMPHKRAMISLLDELDEGARISGAVNAVVIDGSSLPGYNTDGGGMVMACEQAGIELSGQRGLRRGLSSWHGDIACSTSSQTGRPRRYRQTDASVPGEYWRRSSGPGENLT